MKMVRHLTTFLCFLGFVFSMSCGGSSGSGSSNTVQVGSVTFAITDAASDELSSFQVDVTSITLKRANGLSVTVLAQPVTVDLVTLSDFSEILNITDIPVALYTDGTITLDFTNAVAQITGAGTPASILDSAGAPLTGEVTFELDLGGDSVQIVTTRSTIVELDFDLDSSVTVDSGGNSVTVSPTIATRIDRTDPKTALFTGELVSVNASASTFQVALKRPGGQTLATITASVSGSTVFQINGVQLTGSAGLTELDSQGAGTRVQGSGAIDVNTKTFTASYVEAGTGTIGGGGDIVEGLVIARSGGAGQDATLTVRGHGFSPTGQAVSFNTDFTVNTTFANTKVVKRLSTDALDTDDVNVGQAVRVYGAAGALVGTTLDAATASSIIRMQPTKIFGAALGAASGGSITVDVSRIFLRQIGAFDFDVSGSVQADPAAMVVDIGGLDATGIATDTPVEFSGFFSAVDAAGGDFTATALTNREDAPSHLSVWYVPPSSTGLITASAAGIQLDLTGSSQAVVDRGFAGQSALPNSPTPTITGAPTGVTLFSITDMSAVSFYGSFSDYADALEAKRLAGKKLLKISATGTWNQTLNYFVASLSSATVRN